VTSVQREGFGGSENGELLKLLDGNFDVFIMCDKNLRYQQNLANRQIGIIELPTNRWPVLKNLRDEILDALKATSQGTYLTLTEPKKS
jgi:hypothetical protein